MANPSLQIGDSNWAIKEDNLLGYSKAGTRFVPQPITMTRESAGTRVNSAGLVETVELLGSELVTNGDFATDSDWTLGGGWSISNGKLIGNNATGYALQGGVFESGVSKIYKITLTVSDYVSGYFTILTSGGTSQSQQFNANGDYTIYFNTNSPSGTTLHFTYFGSFTGSIDNVSVKEVTRNNLARVDYTDGTSSLLAEPERTNLLTYSEDFSQSYWILTTASVSLSTTTSPDGLATSYKLIPDNGTGGNRSISKQFNGLSNNHTHTCFAKKGEYNYLMLRMRNSPNVGVMFDLENGTFNLNSPGASYVDSEIESIGNGWYKCSITLDPSQSVSVGQMYISMSVGITGSETHSFNGDGTSGIYIWGCGFEEGSYPTSYIPTDGTTVTRIQDQYEKTGISDLINSEEGVLFLEVAALSDDGTNRYLSINYDIDNYIYFRFMSTSNRVLCRTRVGGVTINTIEKTISDTTDFNKFAIKWKSGDYSFWINGVEEGVDTSATIFSAGVLNQLEFSFPTLNGGGFPSKVKQLQVYKEALSDSELATLTT